MQELALDSLEALEVSLVEHVLRDGRLPEGKVLGQSSTYRFVKGLVGELTERIPHCGLLLLVSQVKLDVASDRGELCELLVFLAGGL